MRSCVRVPPRKWLFHFPTSAYAVGAELSCFGWEGNSKTAQPYWLHISFSQALDVKQGILDNEHGRTLKRHMKDKNFVFVLPIEYYLLKMLQTVSSSSVSYLSYLSVLNYGPILKEESETAVRSCQCVNCLDHASFNWLNTQAMVSHLISLRYNMWKHL